MIPDFWQGFAAGIVYCIAGTVVALIIGGMIRKGSE